jgi:predicted phage terminase large subunit-like protein
MSTSREEETLFNRAMAEMRTQLLPRVTRADRELKAVGNRTVDRVPFSTMVEATSNLILEPWQNHLCQRLQKLTYQKGQRILIHKPPQHGGSVIVSQRLPAYCIGDDPELRTIIACHNIEHASEFAGINKNIMLTPEYRSLFPDPMLELDGRTASKRFSTRGRLMQRDGQPSVSSLGLSAGSVGRGPELLIIDDPYSSPQEAASVSVNKTIWMFWTEGIEPRIDDDTNVVIMYHRYHENDFMGSIIESQGFQSSGGVWELLSYRALWDGDERPEVGGKDPLNRKIGEYLSPRKAKQKNYYNIQMKNLDTWLSMFQGKPSSPEGSMFKTAKISIVPRCPVGIVKMCRSWDIASSENKGDWTVGVRMGLGTDSSINIFDVIRVRKDTNERNELIRRTANRDRAIFPETVITVPQDPSSAGKDVSRNFIKLLIGHIVKIVPSFNRGDKEVKADPFSGYVNAGFVRIIADPEEIKKKDSKGEYIHWAFPYIEELRKFPLQRTDDQVDSSSDCFAELALEIDNPPGEDFDTLGLTVGSMEEEYIKAMTEKEENEEDLIAELYSVRSTEEDIDYGNNNSEEKLSNIRNRKVNGIRKRKISSTSPRKNEESATRRSSRYNRTNNYR